MATARRLLTVLCGTTEDMHGAIRRILGDVRAKKGQRIFPCVPGADGSDGQWFEPERHPDFPWLEATMIRGVSILSQAPGEGLVSYQFDVEYTEPA